MRFKLVFIFLFFNLCSGQLDTIAVKSYLIKYDSLLQKEVYYPQKVSEIGFLTSKNIEPFHNVVLKTGNEFLTFKNGILIQRRLIIEREKTTKIMLYDYNGYDIVTLECENKKLKRISIKNNNRLMIDAQYGLNEFYREYVYHNEEFMLIECKEGVEKHYKVEWDKGFQKIVNKNSVEIQEAKSLNKKLHEVLKDESILELMPDVSYSSKLYDEFYGFCSQ